MQSQAPYGMQPPRKYDYRLVITRILRPPHAPRPGGRRFPPPRFRRVSDWIKELAEESTGKELAGLISEWWSRFYNRFNLPSYKELKSEDMPAVEKWHQQQLNLIRANRKATSPQDWRKSKYASIKSKMKKMGRTEEEYYPELSDRLNMKKPFKSLKSLSKHDLGRVDGMVKRDYDKWKK